jgi:serine/threonine-protein kinase
MLDQERVLDERYVLLREIHAGRRSTVYHARHRYTNRNVALKLLGLEHAKDKLERDALLGEARLLTEIRHVAIPDVLDAGMVHDPAGAVQPYIVMELIEGRTLAGLLAARRHLDIPLAIVAAQAIAAALRACHRAGLVHQDVRPANLLLPTARADREPETRGAPIKLVDFDAAMRSMLAGGAAEDRAYHAYLAPEQQHGGLVDPRTDVFALGVVLYQCLTGEIPYPVDGSFGGRAIAPSSHKDEIPKALDAVVLQAISPNVTARIADMDQLIVALEGVLHAEPSLPAAPSHPPISLAPSHSVPPTGASRRRFVRAAYLTPVRMIRSDNSMIDCTSEDISEGGMLILGPRVLAEREEVVVRFSLPISGKIVEMKSVACWHRNAHEGAGATGLSFKDANEDSTAEIAKYVEYFADSG